MGRILTMADLEDAGEVLNVIKRRRDLCERLKALPDVRRRTVIALQYAVLAGSYKVGNEEIAGAMLQELRQQKRGQE
jgi:anti-sigma28 factor (negative regulator of flagellin synthesis)